MKAIKLLIVLLLVLSFNSYAQSPVSHPDVPWAINDGFTDEFNTGQIDFTKWNNDVNDWGTWSWEPENAYMRDGNLVLQMQHKQHVRGGKDYFFTSGIYQTRQKITYGYFEAKIKASAKGQGTCPAFWLYSKGEPTPTEEGGVKYCEIDAIEIFQVPNQLQRLEMNLHTRIIQNGVLTWIRPGQGYTELTHNTWVAPWDPRDEFHTYGVWNRLDSIFWYVDGVQRGAKKNYYWHLPMHQTISMGLRTPYERYINGVRTVMEYPDSIPEPGFPTEMFCDYVRAWKTDAQLYADHEKYYNAEFDVDSELEFDCRYFAGNGETVLSDTWSGMICKLQEITADGTVVREFEDIDGNAIGKESGLSSFRFSLNGLPSSAELSEGNRYVLRPAFKTSMNGGQDVYLKEGFYPITIVGTTSINSPTAKDQIKINYNATGVTINVERLTGTAQITIHDLAGRKLYSSTTTSNRLHIDKTEFPSTGIYVVSVVTDNLHRVEKVASGY